MLEVIFLWQCFYLLSTLTHIKSPEKKNWSLWFFLTYKDQKFLSERLVWLNIVCKKKHCYRKNYFKGGLT